MCKYPWNGKISLIYFFKIKQFQMGLVLKQEGFKNVLGIPVNMIKDKFISSLALISSSVKQEA
jgi:hypothetical protein